MAGISYLEILLNEKEPCTLGAMLWDDYDGDEDLIIDFLADLGINFPEKEAKTLYRLANKIILDQKGKIVVYKFLKEHGIIPVIDLPDSCTAGGFLYNYVADIVPRGDSGHDHTC